MLSDSTGYGGSSSSSFYSTCVVAPNINNALTENFVVSSNTKTLNRYAPTQPYSTKSHYFDGGYLSQSKEYDYMGSYSSDLIDDDDAQNGIYSYNSEVELGRFHSIISDKSYDSYFQSTISTEDDTITTTHYYVSSPKPGFEGVRLRPLPGRRSHTKITYDLCEKNISPLPPRPSCMPWKRSDNYRSTVQLEYTDENQNEHLLRHNEHPIVSISPSFSNEKSFVRDMSECFESYVQKIEVVDGDSPNTTTEEESPLMPTKSEEAKNLDASSCMTHGTSELLVHELALPTTSLAYTAAQSSHVEFNGIRLKKAATFRHERPTVKHSTFLRPDNNNNESIVKRLSINVVRPQVFIYEEEDRPFKSIQSSSSLPTKPILKRTSRNTHYDPSDALFGPVEHIYERIDSEISSSDEGLSSLKDLPDVRPELPDRPFAWPFVLFPPDMTFHPRSFHAYHRRYSTLQMPSSSTNCIA